MILITGATGLLGSHLLMYHLKNDIPVRVISRRDTAPGVLSNLCRFYNIDPGKLESLVEWCTGDITDRTTISDYFFGVSRVYHCAALVSFDSRDYQKLFEVNIHGTANVVNLCLENNVEKLCYASSTAAIGKTGKENVVVEDGAWIRESKSTGYSKSKFLAEREVWRGQEEGLTTIIVNPCVILGPGDWNESSSALFKEGAGKINFYPTGSNAFVDVRDVSEIMRLLMDGDFSEHRFLVIGENLSFEKVFTYVNKAFGFGPPARKAKKWMTSLAWRFEWFRTLFGGRRRITREMALNAHTRINYSGEKIRNELGFKFTPIEETVRFASEFYKRYS